MTLRTPVAFHKQQQSLCLFCPKRFVGLAHLFDWIHDSQLAWDIPWFYSCLFNHGLTIVPKVNLISNIGVQGTHSRQNERLNHLPTFELALDPVIHPAMIFQNQLFEQAIY